VWVTSLEITYDPTLLYIIGTQSGSPIRQGDLFTPLESTVVVRNSVQEDKLVYTISMLSPAAPARGSGVIGAFRVYPLASGTTQLVFSQAELTTVTFTGEGAERSGGNPQPVAFTPVLLDLTISGETVQPPSEATATPEPTATVAQGGNVPPTQEATLVNVTAAPESLATLALPAEAPAPGPSTGLLLAIAAVVIGAIGLLVLFLVSRRR
jgi:hypothetical protein